MQRSADPALRWSRSHLEGRRLDRVDEERVSDYGKVTEAAQTLAGLVMCERRATVIGTDESRPLTEENDPYLGQPRPVRELGTHL